MRTRVSVSRRSAPTRARAIRSVWNGVSCGSGGSVVTGVNWPFSSTWGGWPTVKLRSDAAVVGLQHTGENPIQRVTLHGGLSSAPVRRARVRPAAWARMGGTFPCRRPCHRPPSGEIQRFLRRSMMESSRVIMPYFFPVWITPGNLIRLALPNQVRHGRRDHQDLDRGAAAFQSTRLKSVWATTAFRVSARVARICALLVRGEDIDDPVHGLGGVLGVQGAEDQVPGRRRPRWPGRSSRGRASPRRG